jgi:hypothetical protein
MKLEMLVNQTHLNRFNRAMSIYTESFGKDAGETVKKYTGILLDEVVDRTPPFKSKGDSESAKVKGQKALLRDIRKTVDPVDWHSFNSRSIQKLIRDKDTQGFQKALENFPRMKGNKVVAFTPSLHKFRRVNGVVPRDTKTNQMTLDFSDERKYEKEMLNRVGRLKASWLPALDALGRKAPAWVSRNAGYGYSVTTVENKLDQPQHRIDIDNHSTGIGRMKDFVNFSIKQISGKMFRDIKFKVKYLLKQSGLKK